MRVSCACLLAALVVLLPLDASAKKPVAAAASRAKEGAWMRPFSRNQWALAAAVIETTPEAARTPRAWLYLARARERQNQLVEALDIYERLSDQAPSGRGIQRVSADVRARAVEEAAAVARRIPWADIEVPGDLPQGTYVFVDNRWLEPSRLRSPYPVNPGWHTFLLEVDGRVLAAERVHFEEGQQRPVLLWLERLTGSEKASPELRSTPAPPPSPKKAAPVAVSARARSQRSGQPPLPISWSVASDEASLESSRKRTLRLTSYIGLGMGALGVGLGAGYALDAIGKRGDLEALGERCGPCSDPADNARRQQLRTDVRRSSSMAALGFIVGGVGVIGGGVLFLLSREDDAESTLTAGWLGVDVEPVVGLGGGGVAGRF